MQRRQFLTAATGAGGLQTRRTFNDIPKDYLSEPEHIPPFWLSSCKEVDGFLDSGVIRNGKFQLSGEEMMLFARLPGLTPGQFKSLLEIAQWHTPTVPLQLTQTAQMPKALYYVLEGQVEVNRDKQRFTIGPHAFIGELAFQRVGAMSGGEKSKVALARLYALEPNVLVLDEPTNHLDLWSRDALERSLKEFSGTVLFVSHDRYFLDRVATNLLAYETTRWFEFGGNYTDYVAFSRLRLAEEKQSAASTKPTESPRSATKEPKRKRQFPFRKVSDIEGDIAAKESLLVECQEDLGKPEIHRDAGLMRATMERLETTQKELENLYAHWEEAMELN